MKEQLDNKGLRTHCPQCSLRLKRRREWKSETCRTCKKKVSYNPILDLPYSDTNVDVHKTKAEIQSYLEQMDLKEIAWGTKYHEDNKQSTVLVATFSDGTGFRVALPPIYMSNTILERQVLRIFYHYIKAISVIHTMGMLSKAEMLLGMLKIGESNFGSLVNSDQMVDVMNKATKLLVD